MRMRLVWDMKSFSSGLLSATAAFDKGTQDGVRRAIIALKSDALDSPPSCPIKSGHMYDNHVITYGKRSASLAVVNTRYAAAVHEGVNAKGVIMNWTRPGSGPKWIEAKLIRYQAVYANKVLDGVASSLRNALGKFKGLFK